MKNSLKYSKLPVHHHNRNQANGRSLKNLSNCLKPGFALIATMSVMALLVMIAIAMLSLSTVEIRSSQSSQAMEQARANARIALLIAINELQVKAGPDTRVTAPADAVAGGNGNAPRQLTGAWRSWEGRDHDRSSGLPLAPNYSTKLQNGTLDYNSSDEGRFLGWLISGPEKDNSAANAPSLAEGSDTVPLLSSNALGGIDEGVHLIPTPVDGNGSIAWWIQGQNSKAYLKNKEADPTDAEGWSQRLASNGTADRESLGFDGDQNFDKAITFNNLELLPSSIAPATLNHDISTYSRGLLTNTATGGWRKDLSLFSEFGAANTLSRSDLDVFNLDVTQSHRAPLLINDSGFRASIYPFATASQHSMSWNAIADYMTLYKQVQGTKGSYYFLSNDPQFEVVDTSNDESFEFTTQQDFIYIATTLARSHSIFSYYSIADGSGFRPNILTNNTLTVWNPYNIGVSRRERDGGDSLQYYNHLQMDHPKSDFPAVDFPPITCNIKVGNTINMIFPIEDFYIESSNSKNTVRLQAKLENSASEIFKPGESRVYSTSVDNGSAGASQYFKRIGNNRVIDHFPGYATQGGHFSLVQNSAEPGTSEISASFSSPANLQFTQAVSMIGQRFNMQNQSYNTPSNRILIEPTTTTALLSDVAGSFNEQPFASMTIGLRNIETTNTPTKGYINNKPVLHGSPVNGDAALEDSSHDIRIDSISNYNTGEAPDSDIDLSFGKDQSGYLATSHQSGSGIPRLAVTELPTQSLHSLCELQHFDIGYYNPRPPRVFNAIGNSHATPKMQSNEVRAAGDDQSYDHSYVSNHILFDDWIISSIAPKDVNDSSSLEDILTDYLSGNSTLRNSSYINPTPLSQSEASSLASSYVNDSTSYSNVTSEIEVEGMFNINSTSVEAWKAVLKNSRNASVPKAVIDPSVSDSWSTVLDSSVTFPFPRTLTLGDDTITPGDTGLLMRSPVFNEAHIDALATAIVEQVRKRGPFLSLSEFINRQLSSDDDLALAGAVESALMELANSGAANPYADIQAAYPQQAGTFTDTFAYPLAAQGSAVYGYPGWARQADILRSIAPVLSARDDTFKIRAYGNSVDASTGKINAQAWCEVTIQRRAEYVDTTDQKSLNRPTEPINQLQGRKFEIVSFKWLSPDEV